MRKALEAQGVMFKHMRVEALADLKGMAHDVLINATNAGAMSLGGMKTEGKTDVEPNLELRDVLSAKERMRLIKRSQALKYGHSWTTSPLESANIVILFQIMRRQHENQPDVFPSPNLRDYDFITDHTGVFYYRPRKDGQPLRGRVLLGDRESHYPFKPPSLLHTQPSFS